MNKDIRKYQLLSVAIITVFVYILMAKIIPEYFYLFEIISGYRNSASELQSLSDKERLIALKQEINRIEHEVNEINLKIPSSRELSKPLRNLDSLRTKNDLTLDGLQVVKIDTSRQYQFVYLNASLKGKFDNLKNFIKQIESNSILIVIQGFEMCLNSLSKREIEMKLSLLILAKIENAGMDHVT